MLTDKDLIKIDELFANRVGKELKRELKPIKKDISGIRTEMGTVKKDVSGIKTEVGTMKKDIVKIRKDQNTIVNFFDKEYLDLRERVEVIESRLSIGV